MNIWTHFFGSLYMAYVALDSLIEVFSSCDASTTTYCSHNLAFSFFSISATICFFFSSIFHWFQCCSEGSHKNLLRLDLTGASLLVTGDFVGVIYYGFYCRPFFHKLYLTQCLVTMAVSLYAPWASGMVAGVKMGPMIFAVLCLLGLVPLMHWFFTAPADVLARVGTGFACMFASNGIGFVFYATKFPERFYPKSFFATQVFASHTVWHWFGLSAVYWMLKSLREYRIIMSDENICASS